MMCIVLSCCQSAVSCVFFIDILFCEDIVNKSASKKQVINISAGVIFRVISLLYYAITAYQWRYQEA